MQYYVCKMCGRAIRSIVAPKYCYFDRIDHMEGLSDEDAKRMGINEIEADWDNFDYAVEFIGDAMYDPFTGKKLSKCLPGEHLATWQFGVLDKARGVSHA